MGKKSAVVLAALAALMLLAGGAFFVGQEPDAQVTIERAAGLARVKVFMGAADTVILDGEGLAFTGLMEGEFLPTAADKAEYFYGRLIVRGGYLETVPLLFEATRLRGFVKATALRGGAVVGITRAEFDFAPKEKDGEGLIEVDGEEAGHIFELPEIPVIVSDEGDLEARRKGYGG